MLDPTPNLEDFQSYERACREFRWQIPDSFNIADAVLSRHADAITRVALVDVRPGGLNTYTYGGLDYLSDKFATALTQRGVVRGDRVAVMLPQSAAAMIAQLGAMKLGTVVVPLSPVLEAWALEYVLKDTGARALVIHHTHRNKLESMHSSLGAVFAVNKFKPEFDDADPDFDFWREVFEASADFTPVETAGDSAAFTFFGSASNDRLERATYCHAALIHQLPAFEMCNNLQLGENSTFWTPQHWASIDSSLSSVYPALWYGWRIVSSESLTPSSNYMDVIERCGVTNLLGTPSELKRLLQSNPASSSEFKLRNLVCTGPTYADVEGWATELGVSVNTIYCNALGGSPAASCNPWFEARRGSLGRVAPGYSIEIVDQQGTTLPGGSEGRVAILRTDQQPQELATRKLSPVSDSVGDWIVSEDVGSKDEDGSFWPASSSED
ncbi:MAG TPA: AMP-binding protein [Blastocatellia bacterium]|nr:AMP-binding protein [Blastocatellia bacterium]